MDKSAARIQAGLLDGSICPDCAEPVEECRAKANVKGACWRWNEESAAHTELRANLAKLRALHEEAQAVIAHFEERPIITAEDATEEDARWIMRYDAVCAELRKVGHAI